MTDIDTSNVQVVQIEEDRVAAQNASTLHEQADAAITELRTVANGSGNMTAAQLTVAIRGLARAGIVIIRLLLRKFDAVD